MMMMMGDDNGDGENVGDGGDDVDGDDGDDDSVGGEDGYGEQWLRVHRVLERSRKDGEEVDA